MSHIPNDVLTLEMIPFPEADWGEIGHFALAFDGYEYWGGFERCGELANQTRDHYLTHKQLPFPLTVLRTSLFFEQRRWRHYGYAPDDEAMAYLRALLKSICEKVQNAEID